MTTLMPAEIQKWLRRAVQTVEGCEPKTRFFGQQPRVRILIFASTFGEWPRWDLACGPA